MPDAHALHAVASTEEAASPVRNLPAAQAVHDVCPVLAWYLPDGHASHAWASAELASSTVRYLPATQAVHAVSAGTF